MMPQGDAALEAPARACASFHLRNPDTAPSSGFPHTAGSSLPACGTRAAESHTPPAAAPRTGARRVSCGLLTDHGCIISSHNGIGKPSNSFLLVKAGILLTEFLSPYHGIHGVWPRLLESLIGQFRYTIKIIHAPSYTSAAFSAAMTSALVRPGASFQLPIQ